MLFCFHSCDVQKCRRSGDRPYSQFRARAAAGCAFAFPASIVSAQSIPIGKVSAYLESKMLKEVCGAVGPISLCAASGVDPDTNSGGLSPGRVLRGNLHALVNTILLSMFNMTFPTVKPLLNVVVSVLVPWLMGVAKPLLTGRMALRAARLRRAVLRLRASRLEAMATCWSRRG